jgi:hypothetical protein
MTVATGMRVPLNTQAPPTLSGTLSTARHFDQSSAAMHRPPTPRAYDVVPPVTRYQAAPRRCPRASITTRGVHTLHEHQAGVSEDHVSASAAVPLGPDP